MNYNPDPVPEGGRKACAGCSSSRPCSYCSNAAAAAYKTSDVPKKGDDLVELRFRLADGTDIGPSKHSPSATVGSLKEKIIAQWPKEKENGPKSINDVKLINAGKILENNKTLAESRQPMAEIPGAVITMLVVVPPPISDKNNEKLQDNKPKTNRCSCIIL